MSTRFENIWITGASSGIGKALAVSFAARGANLVLTARRLDKLEEVKRECGLDGDRIFLLPGDLSELSSIPAMAKKAQEKFGSIDLLVNNAGLSQRSKVIDTDIKVYEYLLRVNVLASISLTKSVLPGMLERKKGHIAVVTSIAGKFGTPLRSGYAAAKHGLHGFYCSLRGEVRDDNIRVSIIVPGFVKTEISQNALMGNGDAYGKMDENQAFGQSPEDCARDIIKGLLGGKGEFYVGMNGKAWMGLFLRKIFPGILDKLLSRVKVT